MENIFDFIKITVLGLILGTLIVFLLNLNYWAGEIKEIATQQVAYRSYVSKHQPKEKLNIIIPHDHRMPNSPKLDKKKPAYKPPNSPKYCI